jgi:hypothetical protein
MDFSEIKDEFWPLKRNLSEVYAAEKNNFTK